METRCFEANATTTCSADSKGMNCDCENMRVGKRERGEFKGERGREGWRMGEGYGVRERKGGREGGEREEGRER